MPQDRFFSYLLYEKRYSQQTITAYKNDLHQFSDFLQKNEIEDFTKVSFKNVRQYLVSMMEAGYSEVSVGRKISTLRSFYKFLLRESVITANPMQLIRVPKIPKKLPVFIESQKMDVLLDDPNIFGNTFEEQRDKMVIELLFGTGIRLAELVGMSDNDIDSFGQSIKVLGKRNKERIIPMPTSLAKLAEKYVSLKTLQNFDNNTPSLIVTNTGARAYPKFIYRIVQKYLQLISTHNKTSPHVLRHSYATSLLNGGADLNAIKELLGHASLSATQIYVHNDVERLKSIYKQAHPKA